MPYSIGHNPSTIRTHNRERILEILRSSDRITAAAIVERMHLSRTTIGKILEQLQEENLILNRGKDTSLEERGKRPDLYSFNDRFGYVIAIIIFHTHIRSALFDAGGHIFYKEMTPISDHSALEEVISTMAAFLKRWQNPDDSSLVGGARLLGSVIASTGVTDPVRGICLTAAPFPSWPSDAPLRSMIEERVTLLAPLHMDNYNRYQALADRIFGGLEEYGNIVDIVTDEKGLGCGVISEGKLIRGSRFLAGEIGHICLNPEEEEFCRCGGRGCFEQMVSPARLIRKAREGRNDHARSPIYGEGEALPTPEGIFREADRGDEWARRLLDDIIPWFARGIQTIVLLLNPEIILISGLYSKGGEYFLNSLKEGVERSSLTRMEKKTDIRFSRLDEDGPLLGAAHYVIQDYFLRESP